MLHGVFRWTRSLLALVPFVIACSGSQQNPETAEGGETSASGWKDPTEDTKWSATSEPSAAPPPSDDSAGGLNKTQRDMMELVLKRGAKKAENCSESVPEGKGGEGEVKVLFDGTKGRITDVTVGAPWVGTPMESCVKRSFVGEIIVPFEGEPLEVPYDIKIPDRKAGAPDPKKPGQK